MRNHILEKSPSSVRLHSADEPCFTGDADENLTNVKRRSDLWQPVTPGRIFPPSWKSESTKRNPCRVVKGKNHELTYFLVVGDEVAANGSRWLVAISNDLEVELFPRSHIIDRSARQWPQATVYLVWCGSHFETRDGDEGSVSVVRLEPRTWDSFHRLYSTCWSLHCRRWRTGFALGMEAASCSQRNDREPFKCRIVGQLGWVSCTTI